MNRLELLVVIALSGVLAACSPPNNPTTVTTVTPTCAFAVTVGSSRLPCTGGCSAYFVSAGGSHTANVAVTQGAVSNCSWTAASGASWITVTPQRGSGHGTVMFSAIANPDSRRVSDLIIAGVPVDVGQSGGTPCSYTVAPQNVSLSAAGGAATVTHGASSNGCSSTLSADVSWITVPTPFVLGSHSPITFSAAANPGSTQRSGLLIVTPCQNTDDSDCETTGLLPRVFVTVTQAGSP